MKCLCPLVRMQTPVYNDSSKNSVFFRNKIFHTMFHFYKNNKSRHTLLENQTLQAWVVSRDRWNPKITGSLKQKETERYLFQAQCSSQFTSVQMRMEAHTGVHTDIHTISDDYPTLPEELWASLVAQSAIWFASSRFLVGNWQTATGLAALANSCIHTVRSRFS